MLTNAQMTEHQKLFAGVVQGLPATVPAYFYNKFANLPVLGGNIDKGSITFHYSKVKQDMAGMYKKGEVPNDFTNAVDDFIEETITPGDIVEFTEITADEIERIKKGQTIYVNMNGQQITTAQQLAAAKTQVLKNKVIARINYNWATFLKSGIVTFTGGKAGYNYGIPSQKTKAITATTNYVTWFNDLISEYYETKGLIPDICYVPKKIANKMIENTDFRDTVYKLGMGMARDLKLDARGYFLGVIGDTTIEQTPIIRAKDGKNVFADDEIILASTSQFFKGVANISTMNNQTKLPDFYAGEFFADVVISDYINAKSMLVVKSSTIPILADANVIQNYKITGI